MEGPTHRYMESSPGCWAAFGQVLAREYGDPSFARLHRLTVDAYAVQHPGQPSPQSVHSVGFHLIRLYLLLELKMDMNRANAIMRTATRIKDGFVWLEPPSSRGTLTVADILNVNTSQEHENAVRAWAADAWSAWAAHHETVHRWATQLPGDFAVR